MVLKADTVPSNMPTMRIGSATGAALTQLRLMSTTPTSAAATSLHVNVADHQVFAAGLITAGGSSCHSRPAMPCWPPYALRTFLPAAEDPIVFAVRTQANWAQDPAAPPHAYHTAG